MRKCISLFVLLSRQIGATTFLHRDGGPECDIRFVGVVFFNNFSSRAWAGRVASVKIKSRKIEISTYFVPTKIVQHFFSGKFSLAG